MRVRKFLEVVAIVAVAGCAGTPGPGDPGYAYNVQGVYAGRLMVEGEPFDAQLELRTSGGGRVGGSFAVRAPLEIQGRIDGSVVDDLLRVTLTYESTGRSTTDRSCTSRIEGILSVSPGGSIVDGPVTITDCGDTLPGRMSFRRTADPE
jgi:hypothetical protein